MRRTFVLLPILALVLGGCASIPFLNKAAEKVTQTAETKVAQQEILKNCKYDKAICEYMAAQISVFQSGLTMTSTTTTKGVASGEESVTKMDGKGNMQSTSTKAGKETSNMISLNDITYIKDYEDGKWMKMTSSSDDESPLYDVPTTAEELKETIESEEMAAVYTKVGQEACGAMAPGLTCDIYEMYEQNQEDEKTKMWIDTSKHLSRKMEMPLSDGMVSTIVYTYGSVTITEPSPVKEFSVPSYPSGAEGTIPSQADIERMMQELPQSDTQAPSEEAGE